MCPSVTLALNFLSVPNWLNRILAIGYGARENKAVRIEVFEVL